MEVMHQMGDEQLAGLRIPGRYDISASHRNVTDDGSSSGTKGYDYEIAGTDLSEKNLALENVDIRKLINSVVEDQDQGTNPKDKSISEDSRNGGSEHVKIDIAEDSEEETLELELEFERAVGKMHTHNMYCPNCRSQVTRVILRRKKLVTTTPPAQPDKVVWSKEEPLIFRCLSCFCFFIPSGMLRCFGGSGKPGESKPEHGVSGPLTQPDDETPREPKFLGQGSKSLEVLKSIVYGGLMESITSLGIVSSAAASDAITRDIVALGVANAISGVFIIGHNLRDLKNDHRTEEISEETDRYLKQIGQRENFPLHFTFAILSFLVFGLIPPALFGFAFEKSDNSDYKLIAVAAASLVCVALLAIAKVYCGGGERFIEYFRTMLYYACVAIAVSGAGYAIGHLIKMLVEKLGWFEPNASPGTLLNSGMNSGNPFKASY